MGMRTRGLSGATVDAVRGFNRFYTRKIGLLDDGLLGSEFSLTEVRVLFEIAHQRNRTATDILSNLGLDRGYMSRLLVRLERAGLIRREPSREDARRHHLALTSKGAKLFSRLDSSSSRQVEGWISHLPTSERERLARLLRYVEQLMKPEQKSSADVVLRDPRPGEYGWVVQRHGALYSAEYGWDERFEGLIAKVVANFVEKRDQAKERCWIASIDDEPRGCVFIVRKSSTIAQLRLLLVDPSTRGRGIGRQLVTACVAFARDAGYAKIQLWTNTVLHAARRIYPDAGFHLIKSERHHSFGHDLVGQTWELKLK
jgi:DNA-binding MarR family transcriptional regulator/GNAT superfamily N-acetyltransferase